MSEVETEVAAREEVWKTLVRQLQLGLASKEASGELTQTRLNEPLRNELGMTAKDSFLSVWPNAETGEGSWNAISSRLDVAEPWYLSTDGHVSLSGENMNVSALVERFLEKLSTT